MSGATSELQRLNGMRRLALVHSEGPGSKESRRYMTTEAAEIPVRISGTGDYVPSRRVASAEFDERWGKPVGWTEERTGISSRFFASAEETSSFMGAEAARAALRVAGISARDLDCIVFTACVSEQAIPCTAVLIHRRLGLAATGIPAFDLNATCLGFMVALDMMTAAIATGRFRRVLIVSSEIASVGLNWDDTETAPLFGDGAAAVVLESAVESDSALLARHAQTFSEGADLCQVRSGGTRIRVREHLQRYLDGACFEMSGRETYRLAARVLPQFLRSLLTRARLEVPNITCWVPHQASSKALSHLQATLALPAERVMRILRERGNQIAASLPATLHHAITSGGVKRGDLIALVGAGAGLSLGGAVLRY
jgi:3-oxoacyl-[acyl-carrier-protein] synthase-3